MTSLARIDILNFFLIWTTLFVAFLFPFELFLFSYAVLGPLHYMTEINWLEKKNYFLKTQKDKSIYLIVAIIVIGLMTLGFLMKELNSWDLSKSTYQQILRSPIGQASNNLYLWTFSILFIALFMSIIYTLTDKWLNRILLLCLSVMITVIFFNYPVFSIWFGLFLPTIIHVFVFTLFFMWIGSVKSKSYWGYLNVLSMMVVILVILLIKVNPVSGSVDRDTFTTYTSSNFHTLDIAINKLLGLVQGDNLNIYSPNIWKVQIFIAFAYTYHYLNWFSKTTVINWHIMDRKKVMIIIFLWISSVVLYYFNYHLGFVALYVLSMLHVILEFPLNISSITGIFMSIRNRVNKRIISANR